MKVVKIVTMSNPNQSGKVKRAKRPYVEVVCRKNILVYQFILTLFCMSGVMAAPHGIAGNNRTCPILAGNRNEEVNSEGFYGNPPNDTGIAEDDDAYDIIALNLQKESQQKGKEDYSFLYDYLTGVGVHDFNDTITIGFLGAYGQTQVIFFLI